jgi:hypothetical protein
VAVIDLADQENSAAPDGLAVNLGLVLRNAEAGQGRGDLHPVWRTPLLAHAAKAVTSNWTGLR